MSDSQGKSRSLWLATTGESDFGRLEAHVRTDVVVIGAGIAGLTAAALLKRAGTNVVVVDSDRVGAGVTGHTTAKVTSLHGLAYHRLMRSHGQNAAQTYAKANEA